MTWYAKWVKDPKTGKIKRVWNSAFSYQSGYDQAQSPADPAVVDQTMKRLRQAEYDLYLMRAKMLLRKLAGLW